MRVRVWLSEGRLGTHSSRAHKPGPKASATHLPSTSSFLEIQIYTFRIYINAIEKLFNVSGGGLRGNPLEPN